MITGHANGRDQAISDLSNRNASVRTLLTRILASLFFILGGIAIARQLVAGAHQPADALQCAALVAKTCNFAYFATIAWVTLVRPEPLARAYGWQPRAVALLGAFLACALPFLPHGQPGLARLAISTVVVLIGNGLTLYVLMWLGHSFSIMSESRRLVTHGPYAVIRHPLYAAEAIAVLGLLVQYASWPGLAVVAAQFAFQIKRMRNEEAVLSCSFPEYAAYSRRTRRLLPLVW